MNEIEQEAEKYADSEIVGSTANHCKRVGFIAGAKFAHNAALSEAIEKIEARIPQIAGNDYKYGLEQAYKRSIEILEGLKIKV